MCSTRHGWRGKVRNWVLGYNPGSCAAKMWHPWGLRKQKRVSDYPALWWFFPCNSQGLSIFQLAEDDPGRRTYPSLCCFRATNWQHQKVRKSIQCFRQRMKLKVGQKEEGGWGDRGKGFEHERKGREENDVMGIQRKEAEEMGDGKGEVLQRSYTERRMGTAHY